MMKMIKVMMIKIMMIMMMIEMMKMKLMMNIKMEINQQNFKLGATDFAW